MEKEKRSERESSSLEAQRKEIKKEIKSRILQILAENNISNRMIADQLNHKDHTVRTWFSPERQTIHFYFLVYLHDVHNVNLNFVICGDKEKDGGPFLNPQNCTQKREVNITSDNELKKEIAVRIKTELKKHNLKNKVLAEEFDVADSAVANWFGDWMKSRAIRFDLLVYLWREHGIDINYLICGDNF